MTERHPMDKTWLLSAADRLYLACERAIRSGRIDARSEIGDATLDYQDERSEEAYRLSPIELPNSQDSVNSGMIKP